MSSRNAKKEFLEITKNYKVIAADIAFDNWTNEVKLKPLYTEEDYKEFLIF
jgi:hypothetical protein